MKTKLLTILFAFCMQTAYSQLADSIFWETGISYKFTQNGKYLSAQEVKRQLKDYPEALNSFESARSNKTFSQIMGGLGIAGIIYTAYSLFPEGMDTKWGIVAGSAAFIGFSIPIYLSADKQMCGALEDYNQKISQTSYNQKPRQQFKLVYNANGLGLKLIF